MTSRRTPSNKTGESVGAAKRRRNGRCRKNHRVLALEPLESRQLLSVVPMDLDLLTERAFALSQETYQPVIVPPVEILDYPADYELESVGLVFQEKDAIRTENFLDQQGVYVKPHVRGSNNKLSMRIWVDENRDGWFDERFYDDAQADYSDPIIQPPIDPADIPPAGRVISQLSVGAPQPNQGFPQFFTIGAEGYGRFNGYVPQTVGSSFRVAASNVFSMNGQAEEFPFFREMYATIVDAQRVRLLGLVDSEGFTGAVSIVVSPGPQTVLDVDATWFPRRELVAGGSEATAFLAYSSMFWKDELDTPGDTTDEAHDIDRLVVGLDTNSDGLADRVVTSRMALPRQEGEVAVTDFEQLYGGQPVFVSLDNRDRDPGHFQAYASADYATRASYAFEILHSDIAVGLRLYEQHTASEYHDNIAVAARVLEDLQPAATVHDGIRVVSRHYAFFPIDSDADGLTDLVAGILGEQPVQQIEHLRVAATLEVPAQFATIGAAIEAARPGDTIQVAAGIYVENLDIAKNGLRIVGAGAGLSILAAPADSAAPAVRFRGVDRSTLLTGFSIQGGYATADREGGGIDIDNASPVVRSNEITGNSSRAVGGGIAVRGSSANPLIQDNEIHHNHTRVCHQGFCEDPAAFAGLGGGIYLGDGATGEILGNHIHHNAAWGAGGGIYSGDLWAGSFRLMAGGGASVIRNNTIAANTADWDGGVVIEDLQGAEPLVLENNVISRNQGTYGGGSGIRIINSNVLLINNTIYGNRGSNQPGYGINASGGEPVEIRNNIVVENDEYGICAPPDAVLEYNNVYGHTVADYCPGTVPGIGSISVDPRFVAPESGDFHLQLDSPARNAGDPAPEYNDTDGTRNDLGAFGGPHPIGETTPDVQPPQVTNVTSSVADGTYGPGASIPISLMFDEPVVVTGQPVLTLETGATKRLAICAADQPAATLICHYTVLAGDASMDLDYVSTTALALAGGTIRDLAGNDALFTLPIPGTPGSLAANKDLVIDTIVEDFGDAPAPYPTTRLGGGARHVAVGPQLGAARDVEANGLPSVNADGDDADGTPDDEDGVVFGTIRAGQLQASVTVDVRAAPSGARLDAWIDFNGDGTWNGPGERIADRLLLAEGLHTLNFAVPADARPGTTYARFRLSSAGVSGPGGWAADGEVEDHLVLIQSPPGTGFFADSGQALGKMTAECVALGDLDGDGDLDVFVSNTYEQSQVWFNDGQGRFTDTGQRLGDTYNERVVLGDLDGDGDLDAFKLGRGPHLWWNDGNGFFTAGVTLSWVGSGDVALGDLDGDGDLDAYVANRPNRADMVWFNDGRGNFTDSGQRLGNWWSNVVALGDLDGDGDLDAFVGTGDGHTGVWLNDGQGFFSDSGQLLGGGVSAAVSLGDLDGDGDLDAFRPDRSQKVWLNDGGGQFTPTGPSTPILATVSAPLGDVDGDGDLDAVIGQYNGFPNQVWRNDGQGILVDSGQRLGRFTTHGMALGDLDGDGDLDAFAGNWDDPGEANQVWLNARIDFGDAEEPRYATRAVNDGPRHVLGGPRLGEAADPDSDGAPSPTATGDDDTGTPNDEDGVAFGTLQIGQASGSVIVHVRNAPHGAKLDAWIDFDADGRWDGASEQIAASLSVVNGENLIWFDLPASAVDGATVARFRISTAGGLAPTGLAPDGEVEDHLVSIQPAPVPLTVTNVRSFPSGFAVDFSTPFTPAVLNLTDQQSGTLGPPDITLVGAVVGEIRGSVVLDADAQGFTFVKTGGPLEADTYTVRLRSAANGFVTAAGRLLDGDGDGTPGGDYVGTFLVAAPTAGTRTVRVGDFLRGPGQSVNLPASSTAGIPLTISHGTGVWAIDVRLRYDPALLQITGATTSVAGGAVQINTTNPGEVIVVFYSTTPLAAGEVAFVHLQAEVPVANADAIYGAKHVLDLHSVLVSDGDDNEFPTRVDDGIHIVGYPADVSGNGRVNASDAALVARVAALLDDGFVAFRLADPELIGDVSVNGRINSSDASLVARFAALMSVPEIPPVPAGVVTSPTTAGPDPQLSIPADLTAAPGESLTVPLQISAVEPLAAPHRLAAASIVILFDKDVLAAEAVTAAGVTAQEGWALVSNIDNSLGRIVIVAYTTQPVGGTLADLLANLQFTVHAAASAGTTPLNIAASSGGALTELLDESDGNLTLIPAPTNASNDADVDGLLTIRTPAVPVWHNAVLPWDVNGDGMVTPLDVLIVINYLNSRPGDDSLPAVAIEPPQYYDVDHDGRCTAADALRVVNYLNADATQPAAAEPPFSRQTADTSDVWLIDDELIVVLAESLTPLEFTL